MDDEWTYQWMNGVVVKLVIHITDIQNQVN